MSDGAQDADAGKRSAARAVVALVEDGMRVGLGTGSTMMFVLDALAARIHAEHLHVLGVATSDRTAARATELGITVLDLTGPIDLAIDGADEIAPDRLDLVKGLGGALLREKIVAQAAARFVVVADETKLVGRLGERAPLPVEVVPFAHEATARRIAGLGLRPALRGGDTPYRTDNGNLIHDCAGLDGIADPARLDAELSAIAGVVGTGLFLGMAERAILGRADGTSRTLQRH